MNQKNKNKKKTIPLRNNFLILKSRSFITQKKNKEDDLKIKTNSIISAKSSNLTKSNIPILKIMNDSKLFDSKENKICKICFEKETKLNPLISPCLCEGTMKYVHQSCLKHWIETSNIKPNLSKCEICKCRYMIRFFQDKKFNKVALKKFILYLICFFFGMVFIIGFLILCFYHFGLDNNNKINKKTKKKFLKISISISLFVILVLCIVIFLCSYKNCTVKLYENYEILNRNKNDSLVNSFYFSLTKNPFFQFNSNIFQFNNYFTAGLLNLSNLSNNN